MKIKLQSNSKLQLVKAINKVLLLGLKEAKDFVDEQEMKENNGFYVIIDLEKIEEQIKAAIAGFGVTYIPLSDIDIAEQHDTMEDVDIANPESANCDKAERKLQKTKPQEVTDEDLGVSIHSIDEMLIGWQCKMLFSCEQATRVLAGLHDAKFNVTEAHVTYEGDKATMLVITKTFPTGTRKIDLEKFECLIRKFIGNTCEIVNLEERIESAKEAAIEAFEDIRNYE